MLLKGSLLFFVCGHRTLRFVERALMMVAGRRQLWLLLFLLHLLICWGLIVGWRKPIESIIQV